MLYDSTAHLPKPADPAQMSDWRRTAFTVEATVYYPKRVIIGAMLLEPELSHSQPPPSSPRSSSPSSPRLNL